MELLSEIPLSWKDFFQKEQSTPYFQQLISSIEEEYLNHSILPEKKAVFNAFQHCDPSNIKVVIIGQDPYPTKGHAHGLSFSVQPHVHPLPKSLHNIFKELTKEYPHYWFYNGNLAHWAEQGVFLLNTLLTVREGQPLSHKKIGWELFTSNVISYLSNRTKNCVFLLWGKEAHKFERLIADDQHLILKTSHPSPLGFTKSGKEFISFQNSGQFQQTNNYLIKNGRDEIKW
jgi:uracil-DNA glycosylase